MFRNSIYAACFLTLSVAACMQAGPTTITSNQLGVQQVEATGFPSLICPSGVNGCGGAFTENIGTGPNEVFNATIWCVDSQLDVTQNENYVASIVSLATPAATFDNSNIVRYGAITNPTWSYSLSGYGLNSTDALTRYHMAAVLLDQYTATVAQPANSAQNQSIQRAIWRLTDNTLYGPSTVDLSGSISLGAPAGSSDWITYAASVVNQGTFNFSQWAVVSGSVVGGALGNASNSTAVQTFLVQVTPEPSFYGVLLIGFSGLVFAAVRRRKLS